MWYNSLEFLKKLIMDIRKIALYLAGKLPPYYGESRRMVFIRALRDYAKEQYTNEELDFIDRQTKGNEENFYWSILKDIETLSQEEFNKFCIKLKLPAEIICNETSNKWRPKNKLEFEKILNWFDEIPVTEEIIAPILNQIFTLAVPRWHKIKHGEWWIDFHIIPYETKLFTRYLWVQVKKWDIWENVLFAEKWPYNQLKTSMSVEKDTENWDIKPINDVLFVTTWKIHENVREKLINKWKKEFPNNTILIWDVEELYQLVLKHWLPQEPIPRKNK